MFGTPDREQVVFAQGLSDLLGDFEMWPKPHAVTSAEIVRGIVLLLDPDVFEAKGGTFTCKANRRVRGPHFFLCIRVDAKKGRWLPLYSKDGEGRERLTKTGRTGHKKWTTGEWYFHREQVWTAPHEAVIAAAKAAGDQSRVGDRNSVKNPPTIE